MIEKLKDPVEGDLMPGGTEGVVTVNRHKINELVDTMNDLIEFIENAKLCYVPIEDPPSEDKTDD